MQSIELRILVGKHALSRYAPELKNTKLSELTQAQNIKFADTLVLPHPSPRNNVWLAKNPDFEATCIPQLQQRIASIMYGRTDRLVLSQIFSSKCNKASFICVSVIKSR